MLTQVSVLLPSSALTQKITAEGVVCTGGNGGILLMCCNLMQLIRFAYCKGQCSQNAVELNII